MHKQNKETNNKKESTKTHENAQSLTETGVWIKQTKQDFELNEKQQKTLN